MGLIVDMTKGFLKPLLIKLNNFIGVNTKTIYKPSDPAIKQIMSLTDDDELTNAYKQLPTVYACINSKARNISNVPFRITRQGSDNILENVPITNLFENPNPYMSKYQFFESLVVNLESGGNYYIYPEGMINGVPINLWSFAYQYVSEIYNSGKFIGYKVRWGKNSMRFQIDELIHNMYYNPDSNVRGLSPMSSLSLPNDIKYNAMLYSKRFYENDATPPIVYEQDKPYTPTQKQQLKHELIESRKGVNKSHKALLLDDGWKAKSISLSTKDIQMLDTLKMTVNDVCMVFKVPKSELSIYDDINYATALSQDRSFWQKTLIPLGKMIEDNLNQRLLNPLGYRGYFDYKGLDAINYAILEKVEAAKGLYQIGFTGNEINDRLNLGFDEKPWRDEPFQRFMPLTTEEKILRDITPEVKQIPERITIEEMAKAQRAVVWKNLYSRVRGTVIKAAASMRKYFLNVQKKIKDKMTKSFEIVELELKTNREVEELLQEAIKEVSDEKLRRYMEKHIEEAIEKGLESIELEFALGEDVVRQLINERLTKIKGINETLRIDLRKKLADAVQEGLPEKERTKIVLETIDGVFANAKSRAKTIARTETHAAYMDSRYEKMNLSEPIGKMWITARDTNVRDLHEPLDGETVAWNEYFSNGLLRPHDPSGSAEEVINCRCDLVTIHDTEEFEQRRSQ
jgi:HK97 family phage portal protein